MEHDRYDLAEAEPAEPLSPTQQAQLLAQIAEQVAVIARRLDALATGQEQAGEPDEAAAAFFADPQPAREDEQLARLGRRRSTRPALPDRRLIRRIIRQRELRAQIFPGDLFADPAWDMLLDLAAARAEQVQVSVSSLCIASGVPQTTALRWIDQLLGAGLVERVDDTIDKRRSFIALSDKGAEAMAQFFRRARDRELRAD